MSSEIQKDEYYLPGNLGHIVIGGVPRTIKSIKGNKGEVTITVGKGIHSEHSDKAIENADFEIIQPKQLPTTIKEE